MRASQEDDFRHFPPHASQIGHGNAGFAELLLQSRLFLSRNRRLIVGSAATAALLCALWVFNLEQRYRSTLMVMVDEPLTSPIETLEKAQRDLTSFLDSQLYILTSRDILQAVVDRVGLHDVEEYSPSPPSLPGRLIGLVKGAIKSLLPEADESATAQSELSTEPYAIHVLRRNVEVSRRGDTNVISIAATSTSPLRAAEIAQAMGEVFADNRQAAQQSRAQRLASWLDQRVLELGNKLSTAEDAVAAYRIEHNLISGEPGSTLSEQQLVELNTELIRTRAALSEKRATHARAQQLLEDEGDIQALPQIQDSEIITNLRTRLLDLQLREVELRRVNPADPRLSGISEERQAVDIQIAAEIARTVAMIGHEVETLEAREGLVAAALADAGGRSGTESLISIKLRELERIASGYQVLYERYLSNAGIADEGTSFLFSGVEIIERPTVPKDANFPPTKLFIIWSILLGGAVGVVIAVIREAMQPGFVTSAQAEQELGIPVLSILPTTSPGDTLPDIVLRKPFTPLAEAVRALRLSLTHANSDDPVRRILLTSAANRKGSEELAAALAVSAAQAGSSVLLIDADQYHSGISRRYGLVSAKGLIELLSGTEMKDLGEDAVIHRTDRLQGVDILPTGQIGRIAGDKAQDPQSADLLIGTAMRDQLNTVGEKYDLVIISAPALPGSADTSMLAQMADAVVLSIRWSTTPRDAAAAALTRLDQAPLRGVVLTDADPSLARNYGETRNAHAFA